MIIGSMINVVYGVAEMLREVAFLAALGISVVRFPIYTPDELDIGNFQILSEAYLAALDTITPEIIKNGQTVIIDMHSAPKALCSSALVQQWFADYWGRVAYRYKNNPAIYAFDILNEPRCSSKVWNQIALNVAAAIRFNTDKPIIVMHRFEQPKYLKTLKPLPFPNVLYGFHFYLTGKNNLSAVAKFKRKYGVRIVNTEFGYDRRKRNQAKKIREAVENFRQLGVEVAVYNGVSDLPYDIWTPYFDQAALNALLQ